MITLDSYAVIALLRGEPASDSVGELLCQDQEASLTVLGVAEVIDHLVRLAGVDEDEAALDVAQLGLDSPAPVTADLAIRAGLLRARHYHRKDRAVSLADCFAAESSRSPEAMLATADPHLLDLCREEDIATIPLADSSGKIWRA